jgi:4,5-dihydroxyphthalate decarboxylase
VEYLPMHRPSRRQFFEAAGSAASLSILGATRAGAQPAHAASAKLTLACSDYLRFAPLATGDVRPKDVELTWLRGPRAEMLRRAGSDPTVDGGEASMLQHLLRVDAGDRSLLAIPIFPLRNFTARDLYTRKGSQLVPAGLDGSRIGIYNWAASGAVWYRHLVRYLGQDPAKIKWTVGGVDQPASVESRAPLPPYVSNAPAGKSLSELLLAREIDAVFSPLPPKAYHAKNGPIVRVLPDFVSLEKRYFEDTGCYPPQHVLLLRREVWQKNPWLGARLLETFAECEARFQEAIHLFPYATPWQIADVEATDTAMRRDYHAHGLEPNRRALDVFCEQAWKDGLTKRRVTVEDYFADFLRRA